jgi:hypothetical protein
LIEAIDTYIGQIDATLTQLRRAGCLDGLKGVAEAKSDRDRWCSGGLPTFLSNRFLRFKHSDFVNVRVFWLLVERRR